MTLYTLVNILKSISLSQPNVRMATDGSIYDKLNATNSVKYDVVHFSQTKHIEDEETDTYGFNIFYVSRLEDSLEDNRLQIQSIGKEVLGNILRSFCENWSIDFPEIIYYPFTQKFADLCAGVYCRVEIEVPKELLCADDYIGEVVPSKGIKLENIKVEIDQNGTREVTPSPGFDGIGKVTIVTDVPGGASLEYKEVEYTENGDYTILPSSGYDGLSEVAVSVDVPSRYDEGYEDGKEDGIDEQKAKLTVTSFTQNDTYTREDGWSAVTVNIPSDYQEGYEDGEAAQKAKLVSTAVTENGTYTREDGYSAITVDVDDLYDEGYADGEAAQKAKLTVTSFTENNLYINADGWSAVTVNVHQTDDDLIANLQGDYYVIPYGTDHLRQWAFYNTCFSSITIPDTVRIINAYAFAENTCLTSITIPSSVTAIGSYVFSGDSALEEMTFDGLTPPTLGNTGNSLGDTAYTFPIYVPCESIEAYRTAFGADYAPRIRCKSTDLISALTLNVASAITNTGTATTTYSPATAYTDIYYTSSDTSKAIINAVTGVITVLVSGSTTICAIDRLSGLQDCKQVVLRKTASAITINVPSAITNTATATTTVAPYGAITNLTYSSSDSSIAKINPTTGEIIAISSGSVTFCVTDSISNLSDCKTVTVNVNYNTMPLTFFATSGGRLYWKSSDTGLTRTIQYKKNFGNWTNITTTTAGTSVSISAGDIVQFRGNNQTYSENNHWCFLTNYIGGGKYSSGRYNVYGNILSLLNSTSFSTLNTISTTGAFSHLFYENTALISAQNLKLTATTLAPYCYNKLFNGCTRLTTAPALPVTTMAAGCYSHMFYDCSSLTTAPSLPATTLADACYYAMFIGCTGLTTAPPALPATTLTRDCYNRMFWNCPSLTGVPTNYLPATTLAYACYEQMFYGCHNLATAPHLKAKTLVEHCYESMFDNCESLSAITCLATDISAQGCTAGWVYGVSPTGTFTKASTMNSWPTGQSGIPSGWTIIDNS